MKYTILFIMSILIACQSETKESSTVAIQGHRGARGVYPENTLPAFEYALDLGVEVLEMDVVISKDQQVVVSHEPYFNHEIMLDLEGNPIAKEKELSYNMYLMDYDSIKQYDAGSKLHPRFPEQKKLKVHKPLLSQVVRFSEAFCTDHKREAVSYNVEIKSTSKAYNKYQPEPRAFVRLVFAQLKNVKERVVLQSFDLNILEAIHAMDPSWKTALLVDEFENIPGKLSLLSYKPAIISPYFKLLTAENVAQWQKEAFQIIPWTVNTPEDIKAVKALGVDGIISDYPARCL